MWKKKFCSFHKPITFWGFWIHFFFFHFLKITVKLLYSLLAQNFHKRFGIFRFEYNINVRCFFLFFTVSLSQGHIFDYHKYLWCAYKTNKCKWVFIKINFKLFCTLKISYENYFVIFIKHFFSYSYKFWIGKILKSYLYCYTLKDVGLRGI